MKKTEEMQIMNPHASGIDVGSKKHFVAVGQNFDHVKEFGVYASDHEKIISYLKDNKITTVAMESTDSYWQSLFMALQNSGIEVFLVSGHQTKNVRAKTDVKDCQWIQKLHSLGLLRSCFLPDEQTLKLRTLNRHRLSLIEESAKMKNKMQKSLRLCGFRIDVVINDITGKSGRAIMEAILSGERDGNKLAQLAHNRCRKSKKEIAQALQGHDDDELMFELRDCYDLYKIIQVKIETCDKKIEQLLKNGIMDLTVFTKKVTTFVSNLKTRSHERFICTLFYRQNKQVQNIDTDIFCVFNDFKHKLFSKSPIWTLLQQSGFNLYKYCKFYEWS